MVTAEFFFRLSLCALLILLAHGFPTKGFEHDEQSSSDSDHYASQHGRAGGYYTPMSYSESRHVSRPVQGYSPSQYVYRDTASNMPGAGYSDAAYMPVGYPSSSQTEAAQSSPPETKWSVAPKIFSEEGLANNEAVDSSNFVPAPASPVPSGPVLKSGGTSNVVKEAELGNYQQETEELGYPSGHMGSGFASPFLPFVGGLVGYPGLYPYSYPAFDFRLLYGLYPPGIYTTFSKNHEKGKDHDQDIHYLKDHGLSVVGGSGQKKIFQLAP